MSMAMAAPLIQGLAGGSGSQYKSSATSAGGSAGKGGLNLIEPVVTVGASSITPELMSEILGPMASQNAAISANWAPVAESSLVPANNGGSIYSGNIQASGSMTLPILMIGGSLLLFVIILAAKRK